MNELSQDKNKLRQVLLTKRNGLSKAFQEKASAQIVKNVLEDKSFKKAKKIAFYHAVRGEADPSALFTEASTKQFYLPILSSESENSLLFAPITASTTYKNNKYAIPEPEFQKDELVKASELDFIVMPLLGFDWQGNRLGMGGGYYDRSFSFKTLSPEKPMLMGFAYDWQNLKSLSSEAWDIPLDGLATESGVIYF